MARDLSTYLVMYAAVNTGHAKLFLIALTPVEWTGLNAMAYKNTMSSEMVLVSY